MGEGKTEAAFFAHLELQRQFGHRGMYVALPTKTTGNAMFTRTLEFLQRHGPDQRLDLQLLHGAKLLNEEFERIRFSPIYDDRTGGEVRAGEWFGNKKRALLSEYGVGTIDQALVTILPVRHNFVRLWGLANRVVVLDEVHAYDAYTGTLLLHLLRWLQAMGSSVVLLSATLSPSIRRRLAKAIGAQLPEQEQAYPRLSVFQRGEKVRQAHFEADPARRLTVCLGGVAPELSAIRAAIEERLASGGMALALVNTVQRAQDLYQLFPAGEPVARNGVRIGKVLADGTQVLLYHARFPADQRQEREQHVLDTFGPPPKGDRQGRKILIATQVAEQSSYLQSDGNRSVSRPRPPTRAQSHPQILLTNRKSKGVGSQLAHAAHVLMENRNGLVVDVSVNEANGSAERQEALTLVRRTRRRHRLRLKTLGADKGYAAGAFLHELESKETIVPMIPMPKGPIRAAGLEADARRRAKRRQKTKGYPTSQRIRKRMEETFGWTKMIGGLKRSRHVSRWKIYQQALVVNSAYNLLRMARLEVWLNAA